MSKVPLIILLLVGLAQAQVQVSQQYVEDSAKAFAEVVALRRQVEAEKTLQASLMAQIEAYKARDEARVMLIQAQEKQIDRLIKITCNKTSYFFGLVKTTRCL